MSSSSSGSDIAARTRPRSTAAPLALAQDQKLALALFFISGASGLIYEVAWVRLLNLTFGVSVYAVSTVLSVFMGGLALGGWLFGRRTGHAFQLPYGVGQSLHPMLRLYVALQVGIGLYALLTPLLFAQITAFYAWSSRSGALDAGTGMALRVILAALALLIPTTLMGGTLPALSQYLASQAAERGRTLGNLYAVNAFGAVLGTLAAGLILFRVVGTDLTIFLAAALDLLVAGVALWRFRTSDTNPPAALPVDLSSAAETSPATDRKRIIRPPRDARGVSRAGALTRAAESTAEPIDSRTRERHAQIALIGFAVSGFAALGYQVVWTRTLAIFSLNAVFSFSVMLATFLCGLALGSAFVARRIDHVRRPLVWLGVLQLAIGLSATLVLFAFAKLPTLRELFVRSDLMGVLSSELAAAAATMLAPTLLMGAMYPVAARAATTGADHVGGQVGRLYALNTLGAMLGALAAGFVLIPLLGLQRTALTLAALNLVVGVVVLLASRPHPRRTWLGTAGVCAATAIGAALLPPGIYLGFREGAIPQLKYYHEGVDATVAVFEVENPPLKISFVNGRNEVPTDEQSMRAFYMLGHLPALLQPEAKDALVVSFGNGIATGALARHPVERITAVELVAGQVEAARLYSQENRNILSDPRLTIVHEDGRNFLLRAPGRYDIITADATHPINSSSWALFTREFYGLVREHLSDDGVFIQWLPFHDLAAEDYRAIVATFRSVFPNTTLFYTGGVHTFLVATSEPLTRTQIAALEAAMQTTGASTDLGEAARLASDLLMDTAGVDGYITGAQVVTDDRAFFLPQKNEEIILNSFAPYALR